MNATEETVRGVPRVEAVEPRDRIPNYSSKFVKNAAFDDYAILRYTSARPPSSTILDAPEGMKKNEPTLVLTRLSRVDKLKRDGHGVALTPDEMREVVRLVNTRVSVERDLPPEKKTYTHLRPLKRIAFRHGKQTNFAIGHKDGRKRGFALAEVHDIADMMNFVLGYFTVNARGEVLYTP